MSMGSPLEPWHCRRFGQGPDSGCDDPKPHYHEDDEVETVRYLPTEAECAAAGHPDMGDECCWCGEVAYSDEWVSADD